MEKYAIGLDLGTSSVKAVLFSKQSGVVAKDSEAFVYASAYLPDGSEYLGIDMENFYGKICTVLRRLAKFIPNGAEFAGLAMASASGNTVICDAEGNAMCDGYSWLNRDMSEEIAAVFDERRKSLPAFKSKYESGILKIFSERSVSPMKGGYME